MARTRDYSNSRRSPLSRDSAPGNIEKIYFTTPRKRSPSPSQSPSTARKRPTLSAWLASQEERDGALRGPDGSTGAIETRKALSSASSQEPQCSLPRNRCCWRCRFLSLEKQRARRSLKAAGVPVLTRCQVKALRAGKNYVGKGTFGTCMKGRHPRTGQQVVVKTFLKRFLQGMVREAATLRVLRRVPGVQQMLGACVKTRQIVSVFAGDTLDDYFKAAPRSVATALSVFQQTTCTLQAMGVAGYAHNDIKPQNVCAREQEGTGDPQVTVIDLGLALPVGTRNIFMIPSNVHRYPYHAPELLLNMGPCGEASDAYGLAFLMQELLGHVGRRSSLEPVREWIWRARSLDPGARPGMVELRKVLQKALKEEEEEEGEDGTCH